jgi:hypothetical protein
MCPTVDLAEATFQRLQAVAKPFVDTPETVIIRLLDAHESALKERSSSVQTDDGVQLFNPHTPPDLTFTKVVKAEFCGRTLDRGDTNWNGLLDVAVRKAKAVSRSSSDLKRLIAVNFVEGAKTVEGFRFLSDVGISVQGQDSNGAWRAIHHVAQQLRCEVRVTFVWRDKESAAFPGATGQFIVRGS